MAALAVLAALNFTACGCRHHAGETITNVRDSLIYVPGATIRDTLEVETVRWDTLTNLLQITIRDTVERVKVVDGVRLTTKVGMKGIETKAERLDTNIAVPLVERVKYIPVEMPSKGWAWWKWAGIGFVAGLLVVILLRR